MVTTNAADLSAPDNATIPPPTQKTRQVSARCEWHFNQWNRLRGRRYANCTLDNYQCSSEPQKKVVSSLRAILNESKCHIFDAGTNLILYGPPGTGKDHLLAACIRDVIGRGMRVHNRINSGSSPGDRSLCWCTGADLVADFRKEFDKESQANAVYNASRCTLLAISDPVLTTLSDYSTDCFYRVIDHRYNHQRPTWITVNVSSRPELEMKLTPQIADRLRDGAITHFCNWKSYREVSHSG